MPFDTSFLANQAPALGVNEFVKCKQMFDDIGVVCTYQTELDNFAAVCFLLGFAVCYGGIWLRQKLREKREREEAEAEFREKMEQIKSGE